MTTKDHGKLLGILFLIQGALGAFGLVFAGLMFGGMGIFLVGSAKRGSDALGGALFIGLIIGVLIISALFLLPTFLAGFGLLKGKTNVRIWTIVAAILALFSFPLGTALGIYALWFVFGDEGKRYFDGGMNFQSSPPPPSGWQ